MSPRTIPPPGTAAASGLRSWLWIAAAAAVSGISVATMWRLVYPKADGACAAIAPAPPGCATDARLPIALLWSAILALGLVGNVVLARSRFVRRTVLPLAAVLILMVVGAVAYRAVLYP
jgi:hypothetical protein